ncbi:MAG TPA: LuxR C-terminal-related transcriptional regulator [Gaiellaceae bacterium]
MAESIIARQSELVALDDFLARTGDWPRVLYFDGVAGVGKTRLWREGLGRARSQGLRVLATRPGSAEVRLAFAGIADLLRDVLAEVLARLPAPQRRALAVALLLEDADGAGPDDRAVAAAFLGALRIVASGGPVVVAVDDVQWLDVASARTLAFALRRLEDERVGLLGTIRVSPEEADPAELVGALPHERLRRISLAPLSVGAIYELVGTRLGVTLSRATLLRLHDTSGGNPFYALELARALVASGQEPALGEPLPVPAGLRELVEGRLARLSPRAREALLVASALNQPTRELVDDDGAVEEAVDQGVVELDGDAIRFTHPLLASIHYASASPQRRREVHKRLAEVVQEPEEHARHLGLAIVGTDEVVARALEAASRRAHDRGALVAAAELMDDAQRRTARSKPAALRRRRLAAAEAHYAAGDRDRALQPLGEELECSAPGPERAEVLWSIGKIKYEGEDTRVGGEYFQEALDEAGDDDRLRARILESLSFPAIKLEGFRAAREYAREAVELADRLGDKPTLARALAQFGYLEFMCDEGVKTNVLVRAVALEDDLGGLEIDYGPSGRYAWVLYQNGSYDRARPLLERLVERGRQSGDAAVNLPLFLLANIELELGDWRRAEEHARESYDVAVQTGREAAEPRGLFTLSRLEAARGESDEARRHGEQALVMTEGRGWNSGGPRGSLCLLELTLENYEAAYEVVLPAIENYRELGVAIVGQILDASEALAGMGRPGEGRELLEEASEKAAMTMRCPWAVAGAARARGLLFEAEGDLPCAENELEQAVAVGRELGFPLDLGRSLLALGAVLRRAQKKQAARRTLEEAVAILAELGARPWAERAERELGRIGGRKSAHEGLSATESEIVELVVAGRSNKEVARALHLSPKTVEWNLSKVYRKLGVHSRTELAAAQATRD